MQTDLGIDSPSLMMTQFFFLVGVVVGSNFLKGKFMSYFRIDRGEQSTPECIDSHLPSAPNTSHAILKYFVI